MQKITLVGFLGRDAAVRESKNGKRFVSLTVGVNGMVNGTQKSSWYDIMWFNFTDNMVQHLKKGSGVIVIGELDADLETGNDGVTRCRRNVMADSVTFNSSGKSQDGDNAQTTQQQTTTTKRNDPEPPSDSELPKTNKTAQIPQSADESDLPF